VNVLAMKRKGLPCRGHANLGVEAESGRTVSLATNMGHRPDLHFIDVARHLEIKDGGKS
jgi:hypothetical protein